MDLELLAGLLVPIRMALTDKSGILEGTFVQVWRSEKRLRCPNNIPAPVDMDWYGHVFIAIVFKNNITSFAG